MVLLSRISSTIWLLFIASFQSSSGFAPNVNLVPPTQNVRIAMALRMSFVADSSDYSSSDSDYTSDEEMDYGYGIDRQNNDGDEEEESPSAEETPVPMSKNAGNRFVAVVFDRTLSDETDVLALHQNRIDLTEDHVLFCRKQNLYNETFNTESMADILWSFQM